MSSDIEKTSGDFDSRNGSENNPDRTAATTDPDGPDVPRLRNDLRIIPILSILYLLFVWDHSTIIWATRHSGHLFGSGNHKTSTAIYYFGVILPVLPTLCLGPKIGGAKILIPILALGWGVMTMIQAGVSSWAGLSAVQFFLGAFQSGFWATIVLYLSSMYRRSELGLRLALIFGIGSFLGSFNGPISYHVLKTGYSLAGWKVLSLFEGAITIALAPIVWVVLPSTERVVFDLSDAVKSVLSVQTAVYAVIALFLGAAARSCELVMYQMSRSLDIDTLPADWQFVGMNAFGLIILLIVAFSSDLYRERSTHLGVTLLGALLILANLPQIYYINKRDGAWYSAYLIAACAYIPPVFHAWYSHNIVPNTSARAGAIGTIIGAFHVGNLFGWLAFWNTTTETRSSAHGKRNLFLVARTDEEVDDLQGLKIACAYLAVAVVGVFAVGAWQKFDNRRRNRKTHGWNDEIPERGVDDGAWRWVD